MSNARSIWKDTGSSPPSGCSMKVLLRILNQVLSSSFLDSGNGGTLHLAFTWISISPNFNKLGLGKPGTQLAHVRAAGSNSYSLDLDHLAAFGTQCAQTCTHGSPGLCSLRKDHSQPHIYIKLPLKLCCFY